MQQSGKRQGEEGGSDADVRSDRRAVDLVAVWHSGSVGVTGRAGTAVQHQDEATGKERGRQREPEQSQDQTGAVVECPPGGAAGVGVDTESRDDGPRHEHQAGHVVGMVGERPPGGLQGALGHGRRGRPRAATAA